MIRSVNNHVYQVEDLRNGAVKDVRGSRLNFYYDSFLNQEGIISRVVASKTGMSVQRLMRLVDTDNGMKVQVC